MDVALHEIAEGAEHQALALDPALADEGIGDDRQPEVAFAAGPGAGMAGVAGQLVDQIEPGRLQSRRQSPTNGICDALASPHGWLSPLQFA